MIFSTKTGRAAWVAAVILAALVWIFSPPTGDPADPSYNSTEVMP